jgi:hypothetical protein
VGWGSLLHTVLRNSQIRTCVERNSQLRTGVERLQLPRGVRFARPPKGVGIGPMNPLYEKSSKTLWFTKFSRNQMFIKSLLQTLPNSRPCRYTLLFCIVFKGSEHGVRVCMFTETLIGIHASSLVQMYRHLVRVMMQPVAWWLHPRFLQYTGA